MNFNRGFCILIDILGVKKVMVKKEGIELLNEGDISVGVVYQSRKSDEVRCVVESQFSDVEVIESSQRISNIKYNLSKMLMEYSLIFSF